MNPITIVGGGLAGLSLGVVLRERGIPVLLLEAGHYPRHKVCGEFMAGVTPLLLNHLGIESAFAGAVENRTTAWFVRQRLVLRRHLPVPVPGISRHRLDHALAKLLEDRGGEIQCGVRHRGEEAPGVVLASGRPAGQPFWIGLKAHFADLPLECDLEMHIGRMGYAGLAKIEDGLVNVCGLFRVRRLAARSPEGILFDYLEDSGLGYLAEKLRGATQQPNSPTAVARLGFSRFHAPPHRFAIGDACAAIPPFTGNGMAMALESAEAAVVPLTAYADNAMDWPEAVRRLRKAVSTRFRLRLLAARWAHPVLSSDRASGLMAVPGAGRLFPFRLLYRILH